MIGLNLEDTNVLRRTLEDLEASIPKLGQSALTVPVLTSTATLDEVILKVNEIAVTLNLIVTALNKK